jgi:Neocarzinostatin family
MGRLLKVLATTSVVVAALATASGPAGATGAAVHLAVTPAAGLAAGSEIAFVGTGFAPGTAVRVEECDFAWTAGDSRCSAVADSLFLAGADGSVSGSASVIAGPVGTVPGSNCPVSPAQSAEHEGCLLVLESADQSTWYATAAISFASSVPLPAGPPAPPPAHPTPTSTPPAQEPVAPPPDGQDLTAANAAPAPTGALHPVVRAGGGRLAWYRWLLVMLGGAAAAGALRAAQTRRRRLRRSPVRPG